MQSSKQTHSKYKRLEARITADQKELFQHAAALSGRSLTDFTINALQEVAKRVIQEHEVIRLSLRDQLAFAKTWQNPPKPNKLLKAALKRYHKAVKA
jgi:uncharacterized protein (DUF1778 family)